MAFSIFLKTASLGLIAITNFAPIAHSASVEDVLRKIAENQHVYEGVRFPPPEVLLDKYELKNYRRKMEGRNCGGAVLELVGAFGRAHPELQHPVAAKGLTAWEYVIGPRHYPEAHYCRAVVEFAEEYRELGEKRKKARRIPQLAKNEAPFGGPDDPVSGIQTRTGYFLFLALADHPPALLKLAKLSEIGEVIRLTPQFAYYALSRAKHKDLKDQDLERLLSDADFNLPEQDKTRMAPWIANGNWPHTEPIVLD